MTDDERRFYDELIAYRPRWTEGELFPKDIRPPQGPLSPVGTRLMTIKATIARHQGTYGRDQEATHASWAAPMSEALQALLRHHVHDQSNGIHYLGHELPDAVIEELEQLTGSSVAPKYEPPGLRPGVNSPCPHCQR